MLVINWTISPTAEGGGGFRNLGAITEFNVITVVDVKVKLPKKLAGALAEQHHKKLQIVLAVWSEPNMITFKRHMMQLRWQQSSTRNCLT